MSCDPIGGEAAPRLELGHFLAGREANHRLGIRAVTRTETLTNREMKAEFEKAEIGAERPLSPTLCFPGKFFRPLFSLFPFSSVPKLFFEKMSKLQRRAGDCPPCRDADQG